MKRFKRLSLILTSSALLLWAAYYVFLFSVLKPEPIRQSIADKWEEITGSNLAFGSFQFRVFPVPSGEMRQATLSLKGPEGIVLQAEKLRVTFHFFNFLFGRADISSIEVIDGQSVLQIPDGAWLRDADLSRLRLKISSIRPRAPIRIRFSGDYEKVPQSLRGEMTLVTDRIEKWDSRSWALKGDLELRNVPAEKIGPKLRVSGPFSFKKGTSSAHLHFHKERGDSKIDCSGEWKLAGMVYEIRNETGAFSSPDIDTVLNWDLSYNPESEAIFLKRAVLDSPVGRVDFSGQLFPAIGELKQVRVTASGITLEKIPQYYQPFKEAVPLNIGFSGTSNLEMSLEGTVNHLSLHAHLDLTPALLTYGRFFSKSKDIPLDLSLDFLVRNKQFAEGDFSLQLKNAGVKGTVRKLDLSTGTGELNILTNKFELPGWEALIPPFEGTVLGGQCKLLANLTGNFIQNPNELKKMFNFTLENGSLRRPDGTGIPHLGFTLDYGDMSFDLKKGEIRLGDSLVQMEFSVYNPFDQPLLRGQVRSERLFPLKALDNLQSLSGENLPEEWKKPLQSAKENIAFVISSEQAFDQFSAEIEHKDKKWSISKMRFGVYEGTGQASGQVDFSVPQAPQYHFTAEMDQLNLTSFFSAAGKEKMMSGKLFFTADLKGYGTFQDWKQNLEGEGSLSVTGGEFYGFDVLKEISAVNGFEALQNLASKKTAFSDLRARFTVNHGKVITPRLVLFSNDLSVSANGETTFEGVLNYRLEAFLPMPLAARVFGGELKPPAGGEDLKFGPIPLLLSGSLERPEIKPNPALLPDLQERIQKKKSQKVFQSFPAEDVFLTRPKAS